MNTLGLLCLWQCFRGLVTCIVTLPWIALLAISVSIELVSAFCISQSHISYVSSEHIDRVPGLSGSDKELPLIEGLRIEKYKYQIKSNSVLALSLLHSSPKCQ